MSGCGIGVIAILLLVIIGLLVYFFFVADTGTADSILVPLVAFLRAPAAVTQRDS